jgi:anti-anti-sigma regulatory factor
MFLVTVSKPRQILHLCFSGHVTAGELARARTDVVSLLGELNAGFRLLTDLSAVEVMDAACAPEIGRVMELCEEKGVGLVVRVIPDPGKDIGMNMLSFFHYRRHPITVTCASMTEAAARLGL